MGFFNPGIIHLNKSRVTVYTIVPMQSHTNKKLKTRAPYNNYNGELGSLFEPKVNCTLIMPAK